MMRVVWVAAIAAVLLAAAAGVAAKPLVVATIAPLAEIAREVGGDLVEVQYIVPVTSDPHQYTPTLEDAHKAASADLFIEVGKEAFLGMLPSDRGRVRISWDDWIEGGVHVEFNNPHYIWLYPPNAAKVARVIADRLSRLEPAHADAFKANAELFGERIAELEEWGLSYVEAHGVRGSTVVAVGSHFVPLLQVFGFNVVGPLLAGEGQSPSPSDTERIIEEARSRHAQLVVVLYSERESDEGRVGRAIADALGVGVVYLHGAQFGAGDGYTEYIKYTLTSIVGGLEYQRPAAGESTLTPALVLLGLLLAAETGLLVLRWRR